MELRDGELLGDGDLRLRVVATPGHVSNHVCLLLEDEGLLFTGDHLMQGTTVVIIPPEGSMRDYLAKMDASPYTAIPTPRLRSPA